MDRKRLRMGLLALALVGVLAACTAGDDGESASDDTGASDESTPASTAPSASGPAPGVTDDSIKIGVAYVDTEALVASGLNYDLGDHVGAYQALFDEINEAGGIHGRTIEPVFAPIDPTAAEPAEAACVQLTEDEDVFAVIGFFLTDSVLCTVATHATAVVGGEMTQERLDQAQAPWVTWAPDADQVETVTRAFADAGELDGTVAVYSHARDQAQVEANILPVLEELGIEPAEVGTASTGPGDTAALEAEIRTIGQRFEASGVDTVLIAGESGQDWPTAMSGTDYRPNLLFVDQTAITAFATNAATTDTSILEGALAGGGYGPNQARFEEAAMQECVATLDAAGVETPAPDDAGDDPSNQPFQAAFQACPDVVLLQAALEAAGEDLNYGTFAAGLDGLEVTIPGDPEPRTFGPPPAGDGDPAAYLFAWDEELGDQVLVED